METKLSEQFLRQRKFLVMLPLLVLPFLTLAFWALGGGRSSATVAGQEMVKKGLITELPPAKLDDKQTDKMSLYEQARRDSVRSVSAVGKSGFSQLGFFLDGGNVPEEDPENGTYIAFASEADQQEERIRQKVRRISQEISREQHSTEPVNKVQPPAIADNPAFTKDVDRLESLMKTMGNQESEDPEMKQINEVMETILDIQHPERVQQRIREKSVNNSSRVFPVQLSTNEPQISLLETKPLSSDTSLYIFDASVNMPSGFYGLENEISAADWAGASVEAMIASDQKVTSGASLELQLLTNMYVKGVLIPMGSPVYGTCNLGGDRLQIHINSLLAGNNVLPVSLTAYDLDGMPGLRVPGAIGIDAAKQGSDQAVQGLQISSLDPSLSAQVASAGIQTAKGLFSKKVRQVKIEVRAGYRVLLRDNNQQR